MKQIPLLRLSILILAFVFARPLIQASNCEITLPAKITKVSFSGSASGPLTGNHTLRRDDDGVVTFFTAPHYTDNALSGESAPRRFPVAYTKGETPTVEMEFKLTMSIPEGDSCTATVKASGTDGVDLPEQTFSLVDGENTYTYGPVQASGAFPNAIRFYGPGTGTFKFQWEIKVDDGNFTQLGDTSHRIYLTAGTPVCSDGNRETLFYYACHKPDGNAGTVGKDVTHLIWEDFETCAMYRIDSTTGHLNAGSGELLKFIVDSSNGQIPERVTAVCNSWSGFFANVLRTHGFTVAKIDVQNNVGMVLPAGVDRSRGCAWLVPNQTIAPDGRSVSTASAGILHGQGNDPRRADTQWQGHTIAYAFGDYYDSSYGVGKCPSEADYESKATSGFRAAKETTLFGYPTGIMEDFYWPPTGSRTLVYEPAAVP